MQFFTTSVVLAVLSYLTQAAPTQEGLSSSITAPLKPRQDQDTCPNVGHDDPGGNTITADKLTTVDLPNGLYLHVLGSDNLGDENDDDIADPTPGVGDINVNPNGGGNKRDLELVERTSSRLFEADGYRELAAQGAIIMLNAVSPGTLGDISSVVQNLPAASVGVAWWAADHILELGQIQYFFTQWIQRYNYDVGNYAARINWAGIWNALQTCEGPKSAMEFVLNSRLNLVGVQSEINGLKAVFMRAARASPTTWDAVTAQGLLAYFDLIENNYDAVAQSVGNLINRVAGGEFANTAWSVANSPGGIFVNYALYTLQQARIGAKPLSSQNPGGSYNQVDISQ